jgi:hypothetical protein
MTSPYVCGAVVSYLIGCRGGRGDQQSVAVSVPQAVLQSPTLPVSIGSQDRGEV